MNRLSIVLKVSGCIVFVLMIILIFTSCEREVIISDEERRSIAFILSTDSPGKDYFSLATEYHRVHPEGRVDIITSECRSLACVIDYLNTAETDRPWGDVHLVAHGNSKTGLNLYLSDGGHKATPKRMVQEVALQSLPRLKKGAVDSGTSITISACGIGTNPMIALGMKSIFDPESGPAPVVDCASSYVIYRPDRHGVVQRMEASYWPYYYRRGYRPSISEIEYAMNQTYPKSRQDWSEMLTAPRDSALTMDYHLPISYTRYYADKDDRPSLDDERSKRDWVLSQASLVDQLDAVDLTYEDFTWFVGRRRITTVSGEVKYAVKAIGMSTALCFLRVE